MAGQNKLNIGLHGFHLRAFFVTEIGYSVTHFTHKLTINRDVGARLKVQ